MNRPERRRRQREMVAEALHLNRTVREKRLKAGEYVKTRREIRAGARALAKEVMGHD